MVNEEVLLLGIWFYANKTKYLIIRPPHRPCNLENYHICNTNTRLLSDNLLAQNQLYKSFTTMLASVYNTFRSEFDQYMVVSSAKDKILHLHDLLMSLT